MASLLALPVLPAPARAQISPGPLSRAHANLEGVKNCLACHGIKEKGVDAQCLACHGEIAALRAAGRGLHAREGSGACADCHVEHGGADFAIVEWKGDDAFDHARAGWTLEGKHASLECARCHKSALREAPVMGKRKGHVPETSRLGLPTDCRSCHADPHAGRFGAACTQCHTAAAWKQVTAGAFDHEKTRYPLRGKHAAVACAACHRDGYTVLPSFARCADCHADPHKGEATLAGAAADCAKCHRVEGFVPSTYDVSRHAAARYALEGKHRAVACSGCHRGTAAGATFRFRPAAAKCADCHADAHARQLAGRADGGRCESCHTVAAFVPATFAAADHAKLSFPLAGAHAKAACRACHGPPATPLAAAEAKRRGPAGVRFRFETARCTDCHADPHRGALGTEDARCLACHDADAFSPSHVDPAAHDAYEFRLEGAHAAVPCFLCHHALETKRPGSTLAAAAGAWPDLSFRETPKTCRECHEDPHKGQFAGRKGGDACSACHGLDAFRPASRFDHERDTRFPLRGAHERVACAACHREGAWTGLAVECQACHVTGTPAAGGKS